MARKIALIGDGNVGGAVAHQIMVSGLADDFVIIDAKTKKADSDVLDYKDALANLPHHTNVIANDYSQLKDTDIIISAIGNIGLLNGGDEDDRFIELPFNRKNATDVAQKIKDSGFNGIIICISNPVDVITSIYQKVTGLPKNHVIGTGTLLDSARMRRAVAARLDIDPRSVVGYNLGEHGNSQFTAWSTVRVLGKHITELADKRGLDLDEIDQEARVGGFTTLQGKGYTNYAIAAAAVKLAETIFGDARTEMPCSNYREEYGTYLSYPAIVGRDGVVEQLQLDLTDGELEKLQASADFIRSKVVESLGAPLD